MKFSEMKYERPDYQQYTARMNELLDSLEKTEDSKTFLKIFREIETMRSRLATMSTLCSIRHSIDTRDEFYDKENDYWDEYNPLYTVAETRLSKICVACKFKNDLYDVIPETFFQTAQCRSIHLMKRSFHYCSRKTD